ncbi:MAG: aminomethyl-transferring glycine dehydrogenase subunit GcvPB [Candidatus Sericytochromatia bacterium]|nr:aminomethyl-transferring glycine dehydrogenase subunit GcvPB [Candidatus Sericytochromatia bacterium]
MRVPPAGVDAPAWETSLPATMRRSKPLALPALSEPEVVRHFTRLSRKNYAIDAGFYPLGSCTMKYNPKVNELMARLPGFAQLHPYQPVHTVQGALAVMWELEQALIALTGMARVTLQPAAGAHGELTGILVIKAYHQDRGDHQRTEIIVPDSAHGTNPATAALAGYKVVTVPSDARGQVDLEALRQVVGPQTAGMMLTNPNTVGLFEENIEAITGMIHAAGGLMYYDGANFNAIMGLVRPGDMGFDIVHLNLHKTMTTPHGGGGPGSGPVGVSQSLVPYLPTPRVIKRDQRYDLDFDQPKSIGRVKAFYGNFGMHVRALSYILMMGGDGLRQASEDAVLNANYLRVKLKETYRLPFEQVCMHEFVLSGDRQKKAGANTLALAKRLIDYGYHPPTIYFPLVVPEALMIEPTETESKATLDAFVEAMRAIAEEVERDPALVTQAPHTAPVGRVDEATAARKPNFRWAGEGNIDAATAAARPAGCA